ncbi:MAG: hypothetical protein ACRDGE_04030 [Candidatus Limnocylindria bacterium]
MTTPGRPGLIQLQEFRLRAADDDGAVARMVATASRPSDGVVPLLTSIDDPRDVATLRAVIAGVPDVGGLRSDAALEPLVATWEPVKRYVTRIAERSDDAPSSFRLAVTESGINDEQVAPPGTSAAEPARGERVGLLWIGIPEGTHAGLLVLVGSLEDDPLAGARDGSAWPLPLSRHLGVRVYESKTG